RLGERRNILKYTDQCTHARASCYRRYRTYTSRFTKEEVMTSKRTTRHDPASHLRAASARWGGTLYRSAPTKSVSVGGTRFVYPGVAVLFGRVLVVVSRLPAD